MQPNKEIFKKKKKKEITESILRSKKKSRTKILKYLQNNNEIHYVFKNT